MLLLLIFIKVISSPFFSFLTLSLSFSHTLSFYTQLNLNVLCYEKCLLNPQCQTPKKCRSQKCHILSTHIHSHTQTLFLSHSLTHTDSHTHTLSLSLTHRQTHTQSSYKKTHGQKETHLPLTTLSLTHTNKETRTLISIHNN